MKILASLAIVRGGDAFGLGISDAASVKPGDLITPENASAVADLVSPGNFISG